MSALTIFLSALVQATQIGSGLSEVLRRQVEELRNRRREQALTVADAAGSGRFTLGVGVTHGVVSEAWYGIPYRGIVDVCREELQALAALLSPERKVDLAGEHLTARFTLGMATPSPGLMLAALGPRMLDLAGSLCDGTVTCAAFRQGTDLLALASGQIHRS